MDLFKQLKKLISIFEQLKKLDPVDYYERGLDVKFQEQVIQFAQWQDIQDPNLINSLDYASKNYWTGLQSWTQWQNPSIVNGTPTSLDEYNLN